MRSRRRLSRRKGKNGRIERKTWKEEDVEEGRRESIMDIGRQRLTIDNISCIPLILSLFFSLLHGFLLLSLFLQFLGTLVSSSSMIRTLFSFFFPFL